MTSPAASLDDDELLVVAAHDVEAFGEFYDRHYERVLGWFYRRVVCPHSAADLTAETFARALKSVTRYRREKGSATAWLLGIADHLHADYLRHGYIDDRARRRLGINRFHVDDAALERIDELADIEPMRDALRDALGALSPGVREAVLLRVAHDLPYDDVAARLRITPGAARVRVCRGLARLTAALEVAGA